MRRNVISVAIIVIAILCNCSEKTVTPIQPGILKGRVTIDGEGISGVEITISAYNISGKYGLTKPQPLIKIFDAGDYSFELSAGVYRADYSYIDYNDELISAARYPINITSGSETIVNVELKDPVPHNFIAVNGDASVDLSWECSYGAVYYRLYRSSSATSYFYNIGQIDSSQGTIYYSDFPPTVGSYFYRVTSANSENIESDYEAIKQVDFTAAISPPTGLQAIDMVDYVQLRWVDKPQAVRYHIFRSKGDENSWAVIDTVYSNTSSYVDVPSDTALYFYRLTAVSSYGTESPPGISASVHYDRRFDPPRGFNVVDRGSSIYLNWQGYNNILHYSIYRSMSFDEDFVLIDSTVNTFYTDVPTDTGNYFYYVTVTSPNNLESEPSEVLSIHFDRVLDYPSGILAVNRGLYVSLTWNEVQWAGAYIIFRRVEDDNNYYQIGRVAGSVTSYSDTPLDSGLYHYRIATETMTGVVGYLSDPVSVQYSDNLLTPEGVYAVNMGTYISVHWDTADCAEGYKIYRATSESGSFEYLDSTFEVNYVDIPGEAGSYYYRIRAFDFLGHISPFSAMAYTYFDGSPLPPSNMTAIDSIYKVCLSWESVNHEGIFLVYRSAISDSNYFLVDSTSELTAIDWPSVAGHYYYKTRVIVASDTSGLSEFASVYFTGFLEAPSNMTAVDAGSHVHLEWDAPVGASYYKIYRRHTDDIDFLWVMTVPETFADDVPPESGTYFYKIKAYTQGDLESSDSSPVQVYFDP